jgi:hypothetical protein
MCANESGQWKSTVIDTLHKRFHQANSTVAHRKTFYLVTTARPPAFLPGNLEAET